MQVWSMVKFSPLFFTVQVCNLNYGMAHEPQIYEEEKKMTGKWS